MNWLFFTQYLLLLYCLTHITEKMEIKNQRLPPLPRKNPIQIELNSNKPSVPQPRITSYSR